MGVSSPVKAWADHGAPTRRCQAGDQVVDSTQQRQGLEGEVYMRFEGM